MIKVYGLQLSLFVNKVRFALNALGLEHEFINVNLMEGEGQTDEYKKLHPAGKIPAVVDSDGTVLWESNAIAKYFARKQNSELYPTEIKEQFEVDKWIDFSSLHISTAFGRILYNTMIAPMINQPVDEESLKCGRQFLNRFLPIVEEQLGKSKYIAGEKLTIADIILIATLDPSEAAEVDLSKYANLTKYRNELKKEDWYTKCHSDFMDVLAAMKG